jgi:hypothetical protein
MATSPASRRRAPAPPLLVEDLPQAVDPQVAALDRQTKAIEALTAAVNAGRADFKPAADALHGLFAAQSKLCDFLVNNRLKIVASTIAVLVAVGAISPNAASAIGAALKAAGWAS